MLLKLDLEREEGDATIVTGFCLPSDGAPIRPRNGDAATRPLALLLLRPTVLLVLLLLALPLLRSRMLLLPLVESLLSLLPLFPRDSFRGLEPPGLLSTVRPRPGVALRCFTEEGRGAGENSPLKPVRLFVRSSWLAWLYPSDGVCPSDGINGGASSMKLMEARKELATEIANECTDGAATLPSPMPML